MKHLKFNKMEIKVSAKYWNGLNEASKAAFCELAENGSIQTIKRIITLANKHFAGFTRIEFVRPESVFVSSYFRVFNGVEKVGTIYKGWGFGITERVKRYTDGGLIEVWHN